MRNGQNLEWCINLCSANKELFSLSKPELNQIVQDYGILSRFVDIYLGRTTYDAARYSMASRLIKK